MDAFTTFYGGDRAERVMFTARVFGDYKPVYWGAMLFNCLLPQLFWSRRLRVNQPAIVLICLGVVVGMWLERYEIVVTSLHRPHLPSAWGNYHGTFWDWATLFGTVGHVLQRHSSIGALRAHRLDARNALAHRTKQAHAAGDAHEGRARRLHHRAGAATRALERSLAGSSSASKPTRRIAAREAGRRARRLPLADVRGGDARVCRVFAADDICGR